MASKKLLLLLTITSVVTAGAALVYALPTQSPSQSPSQYEVYLTPHRVAQTQPYQQTQPPARPQQTFPQQTRLPQTLPQQVFQQRASTRPKSVYGFHTTIPANSSPATPAPVQSLNEPVVVARLQKNLPQDLGEAILVREANVDTRSVAGGGDFVPKPKREPVNVTDNGYDIAPSLDPYTASEVDHSPGSLISVEPAMIEEDPKFEIDSVEPGTLDFHPETGDEPTADLIAEPDFGSIDSGSSETALEHSEEPRSHTFETAHEREAIDSEPVSPIEIESAPVAAEPPAPVTIEPAAPLTIEPAAVEAKPAPVEPETAPAVPEPASPIVIATEPERFNAPETSSPVPVAPTPQANVNSPLPVQTIENGAFMAQEFPVEPAPGLLGVQQPVEAIDPAMSFSPLPQQTDPAMSFTPLPKQTTDPTISFAPLPPQNGAPSQAESIFRPVPPFPGQSESATPIVSLPSLTGSPTQSILTPVDSYRPGSIASSPGNEWSPPVTPALSHNTAPKTGALSLSPPPQPGRPVQSYLPVQPPAFTATESMPDFNPDAGHRQAMPLKRADLYPLDDGEKFAFETKKRDFPPFDEIIATGRFFYNAEILWAEPQFQGNTAIATEAGNFGQSLPLDFDSDFHPRIRLGFESPYGPGIEFTYFNINSNSEIASFVSDGVTTGTTSARVIGRDIFSQISADDAGDFLATQQSIDIDSFAVSFFKELKFPVSRINGNFGFQYVNIAQRLDANVTAADGITAETLASVSDFRAFGPRAIIEYYRPIGHTPLEFVTTFGGALLFGQRDQIVTNSETGLENRLGADEFLTILDFLVAVQYTKTVGENRSWYGRFGFLNQTWIGGGTPSFPQGDFGLRGLTFGIGYNR